MSTAAPITFASLVERFFLDRLMAQLHASPQTVAAGSSSHPSGGCALRSDVVFTTSPTDIGSFRMDEPLSPVLETWDK